MAFCGVCRSSPSSTAASIPVWRSLRWWPPPSASDIALRVVNVNAATLEIGNQQVPLDGKGNLLLRYRGKKHTFPYVSAADVLSGSAAADALKGKIVFVGTTALGTREVVATPLDTLFAGVEVQATVADNLLQRDFIRRPAIGATLESVTVLVWASRSCCSSRRRGSWPASSGPAPASPRSGGAKPGCCRRAACSSRHWRRPSACWRSLAVMTLATFTVERGRANTASREKASTQRLMVQALLSLTEVRDAETGRHSRRTQQYARLLAEQLSAQPDFRELAHARTHRSASRASRRFTISARWACRISVLNKPGPLTADEIVEMRRHPELGRDVILKAEARVGVRDDATLQMAKDIVYTHHERWDGARVSAGPARHRHSHRRQGDGGGRRLRRGARPIAVHSAAVARRHRRPDRERPRHALRSGGRRSVPPRVGALQDRLGRGSRRFRVIANRN